MFLQKAILPVAERAEIEVEQPIFGRCRILTHNRLPRHVYIRSPATSCPQAGIH
jgi:hypothetical protein